MASVQDLRGVRGRLPRFSALLVAAAWFGLIGCGSREPTRAPDPARAAPEPATSAIHFTDVAGPAGVHFQYSSGHDANHHAILQWMGGGVAVFDYDGDQAADLLFAGGGDFEGRQIVGRPLGLLRGTGPWQFAPVSEAADVSRAELYTHGCHPADFDNDGFEDVLVTGYGGLRLYHNQGDGTFKETSTAAQLQDRLWSTSAAWADYNGDGALDLYVCHYLNWSFDNHPLCKNDADGTVDACPPKRFDPLPDVLYLAAGDGTFRDASRDANLAGGGKGLGVLATDLDQDGDTDIYVANDTTENFLYLNDGRAHFQEVGVAHGVAGDDLGQVNGSMGVDAGDFDGDGLPDLWVTNYVAESFALYQNLGHGQFQHISRRAGITRLEGAFVGFGTGFVDLDSDGDEDLIAVNGHVLAHPPEASVKQQAVLLLHDGESHFRWQRPQGESAGAYLARSHLGRGLAWGDLDADGDPDFVVSHLLEPAALLRNDTPPPAAWLRVRLVGRQTNRNGVGSRLELETSRGKSVRWIKGGGSYLSQADRELLWALPEGGSAGQLTITWPDGKRSTLENLPVSQRLTILEPLENQPPPWYRPGL